MNQEKFFGKRNGPKTPTRGEVNRRRAGAVAAEPKPNPISDTSPDIIRKYTRPSSRVPSIRKDIPGKK